jgi:hypothetical protein
VQEVIRRYRIGDIYPMQIVQRSAPYSLSTFPFPLLAAPPPPKLLTAPRIAGLLPARVPERVVRPRIEIVREPATFDELLQQLGPLPTVEECDAEIAERFEAHVERIRQIVMSHASRHSIWEQPQ